MSNDDFESVDGAEVLAPRNADGSLPSAAFMRLVEGSDLIDKGKDLGFEFTGDAPDLGAFEWGMEPPKEDPDDTDPQDQDTDTEDVDTDEGDPDQGDTDETETDEEDSDEGDSDDSDLVSAETSDDIPDDDSIDDDPDSTEDSSQGKKDKDDSADDEEEMDEESMSGEDIDGERESADCGCRLARARDSSPAMLLTILFGAWFWPRCRKKAL